VLGHEIAGRFVAVRAAVIRFKVGEILLGVGSACRRSFWLGRRPRLRSD
jgi:D-arabinose 1-dehydrogenase-like Zn-dependent alcohol dehydrogenase